MRIVRLTRSMTLAQFDAAYHSGIPAEELATINGVEMTAVHAGGTAMKRVTFVSSAQPVAGAPR